ncbi:rod shape-determining protein MreC [Sphingomonas baiyangensis]|uniref:Cell shape-determining protein MreC n=1 Tax=Sphingomonas baiyangensis TaxID=2572576 RepID=A0A4U1L2C0_9SPHN|nr:rod shape-determining protein MreC [Sphingomonas baiyangensis]TKD50145.1 rod shape-determining protein MreC [Sphingomonas baiyangensis]
MAPQRNRRPGFSRRAQYVLFLGYVAAALGALVGAVLLILSTFDPPAYAVARGALRELTTPVSSGLHWVRRGLASIPEGVGDYFGVVGENQRLRADIERHRGTVARARQLVVENARLRRLLAVRDRATETVAVARLVSASASSTRRYATLNAGHWQNVRSGYPVRGPEGLIGRVVETSPNTARVLLTSDPESVVPVRRTRDGAPAIAAGRGDGLVDIRSASVANLAFRAGDLFVTSGAGGLYPPGIPVARAAADSRDAAQARLLASPDALDFAIVHRPYLPAPTPPPPPQAAAE